ncbi:class I SAM-dependent methyltransferase [Fructilactobacillus fructivorans]|uniref:class I SAM-dependent methyltransferase n=1 Tax=Fructilactobacillus fructivorans TaxID=1614 RepID=UPI0007049D09|nr:class I SAM-dependent methyltransferase [Fructilactobacillus fructivorans]KRN40676.1 SAM-dependent methyltransferase [Fructilactobacillus fructivorans]KRN43215.1 SAM-dependent methyltransferase [Fructilactobacillus fructivorans]
MKKIEITGKAVKKFEGGYPQISEKDLVNPADFSNGEVVALVKGDHFVTSAYFGKQAGGIGWILSRKENQAIDDNFFGHLFSQAFSKRILLQDEGIDIHRMFNGQGDGLAGITIDSYDGQDVISWENSGIYQLRSQLISVIINQLGDYQNLYEYRQFEHGSEIKSVENASPDPVSSANVLEGEVTYPVSLQNAKTTGLDVVYRDVRQDVFDQAQDKIGLNLFYEGTGVANAMIGGGTVKTVNVDDSNRAKSQLINEIDANGYTIGAQEVRKMSVFGYLDYAKKHNLKFDLITVNVPVFVRDKKDRFEIKKDLGKLVNAVSEVANQDASIFFTTDTNKMNSKKFRSEISDAFIQSGINVNFGKTYANPSDFPIDTDYEREGSFKGINVQIK